MRYKKKFTVKEWGRFPLFKQEILCKKYHVVLTDHMTRTQKINRILGIFNKRNLDRSIDTFQKAANAMDKGFKEWDKMKGKSLVGGQKDLSALTGKSKKKDYSKLTEIRND